MNRGQRHATVAGYEESARMSGRLLVDRQPVRRHHAERTPTPHELRMGEIGEDFDRPPRDVGSHFQRLAVVEADFFLRVPDLHTALIDLPDRARWAAHQRRELFGDQDLSTLRPERRPEPELWPQHCAS